MTLVRPDFPQVLLVSGCGGATGRYRVFHHHEQLRLCGIRSRVIRQGAPGLVDAGLGCGIVILHRTALDADLDSLIRQTHDAEGIVLFDIDDLVFCPELTHHHRGVAHLSPEDTALYHDGVRRYRACLLACDGAVVPTEFLADKVGELGQPVWVSRNCLDMEMTRLSQTAREARMTAVGEISGGGAAPLIVGYASGSRTHDWDFAAAAGPALLRIMARHANVHLNLVGPLQLGDEWAPFRQRIHRRDFVDWRALPPVIAAWDINLAPLEPDNPFCAAKSELKWFEAAACGVPTVAAATDAFTRAIDHGRTGLLALSVEEWEQALESLVAVPEQRRAIGTNACDDVRAHRTTAAQAGGYLDLLAEARATLSPRRSEWSMPPSQPPAAASRRELNASQTRAAASPREVLPRGLCVNFLVPEPIRGSGGHISIFRMASALQDAGHDVTIHVDPGALFGHATGRELTDYCRRHFPPATMRLRLGREFAPADVAIATGWTTAPAVACADNARCKAYFVQDFEPYFQPRGADYALAETTYRFGLKHITLGPWLSGLLESRYGAWAKPIGFGVEHPIYRLDRTAVSGRLDSALRPRIVFYARPATPRRGTALGLAALGLVKAARPDIEVVLFGNDRPIDPGYPVTNAGILTPAGLADLYGSATVGLVLSYTNLSFVPFEMMACGCPVVAVGTPPVAWFFRDGENAVVCESTAEDIAAAVLRLLADRALHEALVARGLTDVAALSWEASERKFVTYVEEIAAEGDRTTNRFALPGRAFTPSSSRPNVSKEIGGAIANLDQLACQPDAPVRALGPGSRVGWPIVSGAEGLYRVDLRFTAPAFPPAAPLTLHLRESALAVEDLATSTSDSMSVIDGEWQAFEFLPLAASAGRRLYLEISMPEAARDAGLSVMNGVYRTWCLVGGRTDADSQAAVVATTGGLRGGSPVATAPDAFAGPALVLSDPALESRLRDAERSLAAARVAAAGIRRGRLYPALRLWQQLNRPMPVPALRPWPEDWSLARKLIAGLRHYGPLATLREIASFGRWRSTKQAAR